MRCLHNPVVAGGESSGTWVVDARSPPINISIANTRRRRTQNAKLVVIPWLRDAEVVSIIEFEDLEFPCAHAAPIMRSAMKRYGTYICKRCGKLRLIP